MRTDLLLGVLVAGLAVLMGIAHAPAAPSTGPSDTPNPGLSPTDVVRVVLDALRHNTPADEGIAKTFEFASPGNKVQTGPLERFIPLVKNPAYAPLLNARSAEMGPGEEEDGQARQVVKLTAADGSVVFYLFILSKQADAPHKGCWMTDGVIRLDTPPADAEPPVPTDKA